MKFENKEISTMLEDCIGKYYDIAYYNPYDNKYNLSRRDFRKNIQLRKKAHVKLIDINGCFDINGYFYFVDDDDCLFYIPTYYVEMISKSTKDEEELTRDMLKKLLN